MSETVPSCSFVDGGKLPLLCQEPPLLPWLVINIFTLVNNIGGELVLIRYPLDILYLGRWFVSIHGVLVASADNFLVCN